MSNGQNAGISAFSYLAVGRETALATYATCTEGLDFMSNSLKTTREGKVLEQVVRNRVYAQRINLASRTEGSLEFYYQPRQEAANYILQNAFGEAVTSATATGETAGGSAFTHTFSVGKMDATYPSLSINTRKGDSVTGQVFEYHGTRINELGFSCEVDDALKCSAGLVSMKATTTSNDIQSGMTQSSADPLNFIGGRFSVEGTFASLTSSSFWHVQSVEYTMTNNLKSDADSRRIGDAELSDLPPGVLNISLKCKMRFDTTTAYDAMVNSTELAAQLYFEGNTLPGSIIKESLRIDLPRVFVKSGGDPEIGGPDEILSTDIEFDVLRDDSSVGGYAVKSYVTNLTSSY